jgi:hypothetical protein
MTRSCLLATRLNKIGNVRCAKSAAILVAEMVSVRGEKKIAHDFDLV